MMFLFEDRLDAGKQLASLVESAMKTRGDEVSSIVYALPRGGLPVGKAIASCLQSPLSVIVSKKIALSSNPEFALGAITAQGDVIWGSYIDHLNSQELAQAQERAYKKAQEQRELFAPCCPQSGCQGAIAILADDGIATGLTMAAAALSLKKQHPREIWLAAPVAPPQVRRDLQPWGDRLIILYTPEPFLNVGRFYRDFPQISLQEALNIMNN